MVKENIVKFRKYLELSQERFAARIGVSRMTVSTWEKGTAKPSPLAEGKLTAEMENSGFQI